MDDGEDDGNGDECDLRFLVLGVVVLAVVVVGVMVVVVVGLKLAARRGRCDYKSTTTATRQLQTNKQVTPSSLHKHRNINNNNTN